MTTSRKYKYGDARLIEIANTIARHFINHQEALAAKDPNLTPAWIQSVIASIEQVTLDEFERGNLSSLTEDVIAGMENCHELFGRMRYHTELAFQNKPSTLRQFGFDSYKYKRMTQEGYIRWLQTFEAKAEMHREAIMAVQTPEDLFAEFSAAVDKLDKDNKKQEFAKDDRSGNTIERITILNKVYEALRRIEKVAGFAFPAGSKERYFFSLPIMTSQPPLRDIAEDTPPDSGDAPDTGEDLPNEETTE